MPPLPHDGRLSFRLIAAYGALGLPVALLALPTYVFLPTLYTEALGLSILPVTLVLVGTRVLDAVTDPLVGYLSDHTESPIGRRRPWILAAAVPLMLAVYMLFIPGEEADILYLLIWSTVLTIGWTMLTLPFNAWAAELTGDYHARSHLTGARQVYALIGTLIGAGLPALLAVQGLTELDDQTAALAIVFLIALPLTLLITLTQVPDGSGRSLRERLPFLEGLKMTLGNGPFRRLLISFFINAVANGLPVTLFLYFVTHRLGMPEARGPLLFAYFLAGLVGIPFWVLLSRRLGKHRTWCWAMLFASGAFLWTPFLVGEGDLAIFLAITLLAGFGVGADLALPASIQADVVDLDTLKHGQVRTGIYFAISSLGSKMALAMSAGLAFLPLMAVGFDPQAVEKGVPNSELALSTLAFVYAGLPCLLKAGAIALMWRFPVDEAHQRDVRKRLEALRA